MTYALNLTDLKDEVRDTNTIMCFFDAATDDGWTIYPDGTVENFECARVNLFRHDADSWFNGWLRHRRRKA